MPCGHEVTRLLIQWSNGDKAALEQLIPLIYTELRKLAKRYMRRQNPGHTLQTTAVIHEAYLRLVDGTEQNWENRAHFFAVAARAMRHVLVDHARTRHAAKRGGGLPIVPLQEGMAVSCGHAAETVALDDALTTLAKLAPRKCQVVELRFFGGLSVEDTARTLDISPETVERDWRFARSFLQQEMKRGAKA